MMFRLLSQLTNNEVKKKTFALLKNFVISRERILNSRLEKDLTYLVIKETQRNKAKLAMLTWNLKTKGRKIYHHIKFYAVNIFQSRSIQ